MNDFKNQFISCLKNENFSSAEEMLSESIFLTEDLIEDLSETEQEKIEKHWSGIQTGEQITTPIEVIKEVISSYQFKEESVFIDIGSGHGHPCFVFSALYPKMKVVGYELVSAKVKAAELVSKKFDFNKIEFIEQDLSDENFILPEADYYYMYNPLNPDVLEIICSKIKKISNKKDIVVISTDGEALNILKSLGFEVFNELEEAGIYFLNSKSRK